MKCPICQCEMIRADLERLAGPDLIEAWACPACGYRTEMKREKP